MGRIDDITLEELCELKDQIDEGKPRTPHSMTPEVEPAPISRHTRLPLRDNPQMIYLTAKKPIPQLISTELIHLIKASYNSPHTCSRTAGTDEAVSTQLLTYCLADKIGVQNRGRTYSMLLQRLKPGCSRSVQSMDAPPER